MKTTKTQFLLFALLAFFLLAGNVNTEGTERESASSLEIVVEPAVELEEWMIDDYYSLNSDIFLNYYEEALVIEEWMVNDTDLSNETIGYTEETEKELEIESWMLNANI
ncbi:MAG: hypothetical protein HQ541_19700 [Mariniphaga sp.]|nr:hypothetical protein [Mariniphaga sp.]